MRCSTLGAAVLDLPRARVDEMLETVSLTPHEARRRVKNYSLGMRQRLGIAHALLGDPEVLVLDEPANGLDPAGIHWMRTLLTGYARRGGTVLLSSHLLHEVEVIADDIVVIGHGRIVAQGTKAEMLQANGTIVRAVDDAALEQALVEAGVASVLGPDGARRTEADARQVGEAAARHGVVLLELRAADGAGLEELFLTLTSQTQREGAPGMSLPTAARRRAPHPIRPPSARSRATLDVSGTPPVPLSRLVRVELRKMADTRAGLWLLSTIGVVTVLVIVAFFVVGESSDRTFLALLGFASIPQGVLLPVLGILLVTQEWGQRTAMVTFTLVPNRGQVLLAKCLAAVVFVLGGLRPGGPGRPAPRAAGRLGRIPSRGSAPTWSPRCSPASCSGSLWGLAFGMVLPELRGGDRPVLPGPHDHQRRLGRVDLGPGLADLGRPGDEPGRALHRGRALGRAVGPDRDRVAAVDRAARCPRRVADPARRGEVAPAGRPGALAGSGHASRPVVRHGWWASTSPVASRWWA